MSAIIKKNKIDELSDQELERYNKHILLDEIDYHGQKSLKNKHVVLVGLGGLGSPIAYYLASSGIGKITIIDNDKVDLSNLQRQILFDVSDIGCSKVVAAKRRLLLLNPELNILPVDKKICKDSQSSIFNDCNLIIDATDNFKTRCLINKFSLANKVPLVMGAAIKFQGQIAIFRNDQDNEPCYNCLYEDVLEDDACINSGVLASLTGVIGSIQTSEVFKLLLDIGDQLNSKLLLVDIKNNEFKVIKITKDPKCKVCNNDK